MLFGGNLADGRGNIMLGAVFQRESWSASIDWYTIDLKGAVSPASAFDAYAQCLNADGGSNPT
jgi:hypothetical protein